MDGRKISSRTFWLIAGLLTLFGALITVQSRGQYCLPIFSGAGSDALSSLDPYIVREGRPDFFKYGPIWALVLIPLSWLPPLIAPWFWYVLNAVAFWQGCQIYQRHHFGERKFAVMDWVLLTPLFLTNGFYGQINGVLWWMIAVALTSRSSWTAALALSAAAWMKLFPAVLGVLFFKNWKWDHQRGSWALGIFLGILAGIVLPALWWSPEIFVSWWNVVNRDFGMPHHKLGLLSLLMDSGISQAPALWFQKISAVLYFGALIAIFFRSERKLDQTVPVTEALFIVGFLIFSHMTEPPTLALLAPAILVIRGFGLSERKLRGVDGALLVLLVILPSDLIPVSFKNALGGQYAIKTYALLFSAGILGFALWRTRQGSAPSLARL